MHTYRNNKLLIQGLLQSNIRALPFFKQSWMYELQI